MDVRVDIKTKGVHLLQRGEAAHDGGGADAARPRDYAQVLLHLQTGCQRDQVIMNR